MRCADCGVTCVRRSPSQRYCTPCSGARDTARKAAWGRENPQPFTPEKAVAAQRRMSEIREAGAERSIASRASMTWPLDRDDPESAHTVHRIAVPFSYSASKNAVWRMGRGGHVYARQEANNYRALIANMLRSGGPRWFQAKLWIDIFVEKPNHRGDAVNVVDLVCDAIKDATGVDDRWYSIWRLDWSIVKENPRLIIGVRQSAVQDQQICSSCGVAWPLTAEHFQRNRSMKSGFTRNCKPCTHARKGTAA